MARLPLVDDDDTARAALIAKLKGARRGKLLNLYRVLLNSASIAEAWQTFNSAIRNNTALVVNLRVVEASDLRPDKATGM